MAALPLELEPLCDRTIVLVGLAREGLSSYRYIRQFLPAAKILLIDDQPPASLTKDWQQILNLDSQTQFITSSTAVAELKKMPVADVIVVKSPGIPLEHPLVKLAAERKLTTTSNVALFLAAIDRLRTEGYDIRTIGITGTKGKSTTTSLIHHVLQAGGVQTWVGGNIGVPALELLQNLPQINRKEILYIVLELSAHQLDELDQSPNWAVIQNIVPEHLDYYGTFERYVAAKSHITQFQTANDVVIFNPAFEITSQLAELSSGKKLGFSTQGEISDFKIAAQVKDDWIWDQDRKVMAVADLPLLGEHNLENMLPAVIVGDLAGLKTAQIANALRSFQALPHRLEPVGVVDGISYFNDSLSTVPEATLAALMALGDRPIILLAGGYDRGQDFSELAEYLAVNPVKALVLFPPTGRSLAQAVKQSGGHIPITQVETMPEAMTVAKKLAQSGDVVLLSPASASFGGFKDYQDRGNQFMALIHEQANDRINDGQDDTKE